MVHSVTVTSVSTLCRYLLINSCSTYLLGLLSSFADVTHDLIIFPQFTALSYVHYKTPYYDYSDHSYSVQTSTPSPTLLIQCSYSYTYLISLTIQLKIKGYQFIQSKDISIISHQLDFLHHKKLCILYMF